MLERILGKDPDEMFPYETERILIIRDLLLAIIGYIFYFAVVIYTILYVFIILEKYNETGNWNGYVYYNVIGKGYSQDDKGNIIVWDQGDILYPEQDSKALLIGIYMKEIQEQQIDNCLLQCK